MKKIYLSLALFLLSLAGFTQSATVECWGRYEVALNGPQTGNPFADVWLKAAFTQGAKTITVDGFYDGNGKYLLRFMPAATGEWRYTTRSNQQALNGKTGSFQCIPASPGNHGPVKVWNTYHFQYADGKPYYPFGTTLYAWTHQGKALQEQTLNTLREAHFNKVRMCVFPKYYAHVEEEPELYPYERKGTGGKGRWGWDFTRFNPAFFHHLEKRLDDLGELGIEADVIIFHPYDKGHWGFDSMGKPADLFYIRYLIARLASFRQVWWSMANEWDFIKTKPKADWDDYTKAVVQADPYGHLCSIHNGSLYYDNWKPAFTHASIQNGSAVEDFGRAVLLRDVYYKPVIYDEVCYEGDIPERWGRLSGQEMTHAFWQGIIAGTYVTHGETYTNSGDTIFWAKGGRLRGTSPPRIGFLRSIMEGGPGPLQLADPWKDHQTAYANKGYYLVYFGKGVQDEWIFSLPKKGGPETGATFKVEIIDTWDMTVTPVAGTFQTAAPDGYRIFDTALKKIKLPAKPYLALRISRVDK